MTKKTYTQSELYRAHDYSIKNREELSFSISCGCFCCGTLFMAYDIRDWVLEDDGQQTAICPYCGSNSVIGDRSVHPLTKDFLLAMKKFWFR